MHLIACYFELTDIGFKWPCYELPFMYLTHSSIYNVLNRDKIISKMPYEVSNSIIIVMLLLEKSLLKVVFVGFG